MARVKARYDIIDRDLEAQVPEASPAEQDKMFQDFARFQLGEALKQNKQVLGQMPDYDTRVDGTVAPLTAATVSCSL